MAGKADLAGSGMQFTQYLNRYPFPHHKDHFGEIAQVNLGAIARGADRQIIGDLASGNELGVVQNRRLAPRLVGGIQQSSQYGEGSRAHDCGSGHGTVYRQYRLNATDEIGVGCGSQGCAVVAIGYRLDTGSIQNTSDLWRCAASSQSRPVDFLGKSLGNYQCQRLFQIIRICQQFTAYLEMKAQRARGNVHCPESGLTVSQIAGL